MAKSGETALSIAQRARPDLLDFKQLIEILENFCNAVGIVSAIIDLQGNVLAVARWQRICNDFHRSVEGACARCIESDTELAIKLEEGKPFSIYRCKNGMTDAASPIVIRPSRYQRFYRPVPAG